jgi:hypothetical protein
VAIERGLRAAEARFGPVVLGRVVGGDGEKSGAWLLSGERGDLELRLELEGPGGAIVGAVFVPRPLTGPDQPP